MNHLLSGAIVLVGAIILVRVLALAEPDAGDSPFRDLTFEEACARAEREGRIVLVDWFTTWCAPCRKLDRETWPDPDVRAFLDEETVALKLDAERETELAARFRVVAYPTILFLEPDGTVKGKLTGFRDAKRFLAEARDALAGRSPVDRIRAELATGNGDDPMLRQELGAALVDAGDPEGALEEFLWCFDHGAEHSAGFAGVRLSFLLSRIEQLGRSYPPALDALRLRRDRAAKALTAGTRTVSDALEFSRLNGVLGEEEETLAVYDALFAAGPEAQAARAVLFPDVLPALVEAKRYADVVAGAGDVDAAVRTDIRQHRQIALLMGTFAPSAAGDEGEAADEARSREFMKDTLVRKCGGYYEAQLGIVDLAGAASTADRLIEFHGTASTYAALFHHARRAGAGEAARALLARAYAELPEGEHASLEELLAPRDG